MTWVVGGTVSRKSAGGRSRRSGDAKGVGGVSSVISGHGSEAEGNGSVLTKLRISTTDSSDALTLTLRSRAVMGPMASSWTTLDRSDIPPSFEPARAPPAELDMAGLPPGVSAPPAGLLPRLPPMLPELSGLLDRMWAGRVDDEADAWDGSVSLARFPLTFTGSSSSWMILCLLRSLAACSVDCRTLFLVASDTVVCRTV
jgi:hypothetical protein